MRLPSFFRRREIRTKTRKRRELERRISLERLELRQMLSANNQPPTVNWGNGGGNAGLSNGQAHYFSTSELGYQDADGDSLDHITILSLPTQGSLSLYGYYPVSSGQAIDAYSLNSGYLVYTPNSNASASYTTAFAFSVNDGQDNSLPASLTLNVAVTPNAPPTITGSVHSLSSTSSKAITTTDLGYADAEGDQLQSITVTALPTSGTLLRYGYPVSAGTTIDAYELYYGSVVYQPSTTATASYADSFSFTASTGSGSSSPATIGFNVTVTPNVPPTVSGSVVAVASGTSKTLTLGNLGYSDPEGDLLQSITITALPTTGTLTLYGYPVAVGTNITPQYIEYGYLAYAPDANNPSAHSAEFSFTASDGHHASSPATVTLNVAGNSNTAPVTASLSRTVDTGTFTLVTANIPYSDADGDALDHITILSLPAQGTLTLGGYSVANGQTIDSYALDNGYLVYTADTSALASYSTSFAFSANDGQINSFPATFTLNVTVAPNSPPTIAGSVHSISSTTSKTIAIADLGYSDADGNPLQSITVAALPTSGTLLRYGYAVSVGSIIGADEFYYGTIVYQPSATATTSYADAFLFTANDGAISSASASIVFNVSVTPNAAPSVTGSVVSVNSGLSKTLTVDSLGYSDVEGELLQSITITALPATGTLTLYGYPVALGTNVTRQFIEYGYLAYTPDIASHSAHVATVSFTASDGHQSSSPATITLDVAGKTNTAPVTANLSLTVPKTGSHTLTAETFPFSDNEGDDLDHIVISSLPSQGTLSLGGYPVTSGQIVDLYALDNGYLVYTPNSNAPASYATSFAFTVNDGQTSSLPASLTFNVTVTATPNTPPTVTGHVYSILSTGLKTIVTADLGYADADGDALQWITILALPTSGTLLRSGNVVSLGSTINAVEFGDGSIVYHPSTAATTTYADTFSFTASDGTTPSTLGALVFNVSVTSNAPPSVTGGSITVASDSSKTLTVSNLGYSDSDGDLLQSITITALPTTGTLSLYGNPVAVGTNISTLHIESGFLAYTPAIHTQSAHVAAFSFTANDGHVSSSPGTIMLNVTVSGTIRNSIESVGLVRDTGVDHGDKVTIDPRIQGIVEGDFGTANLKIEFDHNLDGVSDGSIDGFELDRNFVYDPRSFDATFSERTGSVSISYRLVVSEDLGEVTASEWNHFSFVIQSIPSSNLRVEGLEYRSDIVDKDTSFTSSGIYLNGRVVGANSRDRFSGQNTPNNHCAAPAGPQSNGGVDSSIGGSAFANVNFDITCELGNSIGSFTGDQIPGRVEPLTVQIDIDGDENPDLETVTRGDRLFLERLRGLDGTALTVSARVREWSVEFGAFLEGEWSSLSIPAQGPTGPIISSAEFVAAGVETNTVAHSTPTLHGVFAASGRGFGLIHVEVDLNNDNAIDHDSFADENGEFSIALTQLQQGYQSIRVRGTAWSDVNSTDVSGDWKTVGLIQTASGVASVEGLKLLVDNGTSATDQITSVPTIAGNLTTGDGEPVNVFIDTNNDSEADASFLVQPGEHFIYSPDSLTPGEHTLHVWTATVASAGKPSRSGTATNIHVTLVSPTTANQSLQIKLAEDTGLANDRISSSARFSGQLTGVAQISGQTIEWDANGDSIADGQTQTDASGHFAFVPTLAGFGEYDVSVRTVVYDPVTSSVVKGQWVTSEFTWIEAERRIDTGNNNPQVAQNGGSNNFGSNPGGNYDISASQRTSDGIVEGYVSGGVEGDLLIVEVDTNSDGIVDASSLPASNGSFTFTFLETVSLTSGTASRLKVIRPNGEIIGTAWSIVQDNNSYSGSAPGAPSTTGAPSTGAPSTGAPSTGAPSTGAPSTGAPSTGAPSTGAPSTGAPGTGGGGPEPTTAEFDVAKAKTEAGQRQTANESTFAGAVISATLARTGLLSTADSTYTGVVTAANTAFETAQANADAAYQTALASYTGDLSTVNIEPIDFHVGDPLTDVSLPIDSNQPTPPMLRPTFSGPSFNLAGDPTYQANIYSAGSTFRSAPGNAKTVRQQDDRAAKEAFDQKIRTRRDIDNPLRQTIADTYEAAVAVNPATDLDAAYTTYRGGVQPAYDGFNTTVSTAGGTRNQSIRTASDTLSGDYVTHQATYTSDVDSAADTRNSVLNADPAPSTAERNDAWEVFNLAVFNFAKQRDLDNADSYHDYEIAVIEANRTFSLAYVGAQKLLADTVRPLWNTYEKAIAQHDLEVAIIRIDADAIRDQSTTNLNFTSNSFVASARKDFDYQLAANAHRETMAIESARAQFWVDSATAHRDAMQRWNTAVATPWTDYQLQLAGNRLDLALSMQTAHGNHSRAVADADEAKSKAKADADYVRTLKLENEKKIGAPARIASEKTFRRELGEANTTGAKKQSDNRADLDEAMTTAFDTRATAAIESGYTYAKTIADARLAYSQTMINGRRIHKGIRPSTSTGASAAFAIACNNAYRTLIIDQITQDADFGSSARTAWFDFIAAQLETEGDRKNANATSRRTFDNKSSAQTTANSIVFVQAEAAHQKAIHAASLIYVQTVAPEDKIYDDGSVLLTANTSIDDAQELKDYYLAEATAYKTVISLWNSSTNTPWTELQLDKAEHDYQWALDAGVAELQYANAMQNAETTRQNELSVVTKSVRINIATATKTRDDSLSDQTVTFVTNIAGPQQTTSEVETEVAENRVADEVTRDKDALQDERDFAEPHANDASDTEKQFQIAMINANFDYTNATIQAQADLSGKIGDSYEDYTEDPDDSFDEAQHLQNIDDAVDAYNTAMSTATDDYNTAGSDATDAVHTARHDLFKRWAEQRAKNLAVQKQAKVSEDEVDNVAQLGVGQQDLAQAILDATIALANARRDSQDLFATTVNNLDTPAATTRTTRENQYRTNATSNSNLYDRSIYVAEATKREGDISSRGIYEADWYTAFALQMSASADPLASPAAAAATAKADFANSIRLDRDTYEIAITTAGLTRLISVHSAEHDRVVQINIADLTYTQNITPTQVSHSIAVEKADNSLAAKKTIAEAEYDKIVADTAANRADLLAQAAKQRNDDIVTADDIHAIDVGAANGTFFDDSCNNPQWTDRVWTDISAEDVKHYGYYGFGYGSYYGGYGYGGYGYGGYGYGGYGYGGYGYGGYGYGGYGYGGYGYGGYGYGGYGYGYGFSGYGYGYGWGGYGNGYCVASTASSDALAAGLANADDAFDVAKDDADRAFAESAGDAEIALVKSRGDAKSAMVEKKGNADVAYVTTVGAADLALATASKSADHTRMETVAVEDEALANATQNELVDQLTTVSTQDSIFQNHWATAIGVQSNVVAATRIDAWILLAQAEANVFAPNTEQAVQAQARVNGFQAMRTDFIAHQQAVATAEADLAAALTTASGIRNVADADAERDFQAHRNEAQRIRQIDSENAYGTYSVNTVPVENTRWTNATQYQAKYHHEIAKAEAAKLLAVARAAKTRDMDLADDDPGVTYDADGYPELSEAEKTYRKAVADAVLTYQTALPNQLKALQTNDATSKATYTRNTAEIDYTFDDNVAGFGLTYQNAVVDSERTRAVAEAVADRDYLDSQASAKATRRTTLAVGVAKLRSAKAAADFAAYDHIDSEYNLPYTAYLRGLAQIQQSLTSQVVIASATLVADRNTADADYSDTVIPEIYNRDVAFADAAKTRGRATAQADHDASEARARASKTFYLDSAGPATTYATNTAATLATYAIDVATAEKTFVDEQVDKDDDANTHRNDALTTAATKQTTDRNSARTTWWSAEAGAHADLRIAVASADRDWSKAILSADKDRIVEENNVQKTLRDVQSNAYHTSETAWAEHDQAFYLAEINASAALSSGLSDPWSVRDDNLRSGRAPSDRDRLSASLTRTTTGITAQRDIELAENQAETNFRNGSTSSAQTQNGALADASLKSITNVANAHRTAGNAGSLPAATTPTTPRSGTLSIANQISVSMSSAAWLAVTDRVINRTEDWINDLYSESVDYELDLGSEILNQRDEPSAAATTIANVLLANVKQVKTNVPSRGLISPVENPLSNPVEDGGVSFGESAINVASVLANALLPKWMQWGATLATGIGATLLSSQVAVTQTSTWSSVRVLDLIRSITPEVAGWIQRRQAVILFTQASGSDVKIHAVSGSGGNALIVEIGIGLNDIQAANLILQRVGTMVTAFKQVITGTKDFWGYSPWSDAAIGTTPDPFYKVSGLVAAQNQNMVQLEAELQKGVTGVKIAVSITPAGELYAFVEAAGNNDPLGAILAGGGLVLTAAGTAYKLSKSHNLGTTAVYKLDDVPVSAAPSSGVVDFAKAGAGANWNNLDQLKTYLRRHPVGGEYPQLITGKTADAFLTAKGKGAAFVIQPNGTFGIFIRTGATKREVLHEIGHLLTFEHVGSKAAYEQLGLPMREHLASLFVLTRQGSISRLTLAESALEDAALLSNPNYSETILDLLRKWGIKP